MIDRGPRKRPSVHPSPLSLPFWEGCRRHQLLLQHCERCGSFVFYPRTACPGCGCRPLVWVRASGRGVLHTFTVARRPTHPALAGAVPYVIAVIELVEGPRMTGSVAGCPAEQLRIGMNLTVDFEDGEETTLPVWRARAL